MGGLQTTGIYPEKTRTRGRRCKDLHRKAQLKARTTILRGDFNQVANSLFFTTQYLFNQKHHQVRASKEELRSCNSSWILDNVSFSYHHKESLSSEMMSVLEGALRGEGKCEVVFGDMENADGCVSGRKRRPELIHRRLHWKTWK